MRTVSHVLEERVQYRAFMLFGDAGVRDEPLGYATRGRAKPSNIESASLGHHSPCRAESRNSSSSAWTVSDIVSVSGARKSREAMEAESPDPSAEPKP